MENNVRPAVAADAVRIVAWQLAMAHETEGLVLAREVVRRGVEHVFSHTELGHYLICERNGAPAGCMLLLSEWSDWRCGFVLWIHSVYVEPAARRNGVFTALYRSAQECVSRSDDLRGLRLYVDKRNSAALETYRELGMDGSHYALFEWMK